MRCPYCATELVEAAVVCASCGAEYRSTNRRGLEVWESPGEQRKRLTSTALAVLILGPIILGGVIFLLVLAGHSG